MWRPPDGWDDTPAGDVEGLQILNHGAANMEFDPATLAAHGYFTEVTGIGVDAIEAGVDLANTREQQLPSSGEGAPHAFNLNGILVPEFVRQGSLEVTDAPYPEGGFDRTSRRCGACRAGRRRVDGGHAHLRLPEHHRGERGTRARGPPGGAGDRPLVARGEWSRDLLEEIRGASADTDVFGFAYYAVTSTYLAYSFRELLFQQGGRMVRDDGTVVTNSEAAVRVVERMKEWRDAGDVPPDVISYGEGDIVDLFSAGRVAYTTALSDLVPRLLQEYGAGPEYRVVVPPAADAGPSPSEAGPVAPNATSVNRFSDAGHRLAALLYGDPKLSSLVQWWEFTCEGNMSFMNRVYADAGEADFGPFGQVPGQAIDNGVLAPFPRMSSVFQRMFGPIQRVLQANVEPQAAMPVWLSPLDTAGFTATFDPTHSYGTILTDPTFRNGSGTRSSTRSAR